MKAREITEAGKEALRSGRFQVVRVNYANPGAPLGSNLSLPCRRALAPVERHLAFWQAASCMSPNCTGGVCLYVAAAGWAPILGLP